MKALVHTVREIEQHDVVTAAIFAHEYWEKGPWERTRQALKTLEDPTELYVVEGIPKASF
jgi:hypothetical protein